MKNKQKTIQFQIGDLLPIGMTIVVLGIAVAYGIQVMGEAKQDIGVSFCARGTLNPTYNATDQTCWNGTTTAASGTTGYNVQGSDAYSATTSGIEGVAQIPEKLPTIVTVVVAAVIIGILITYLAGRFMR